MSDIGVVVVPRDQNPYQEALYTELRRRGFKVRYGSQLTGSRSLNLLALPFEMAWARSRGFRILHIHWTFGFMLGGRRNSVTSRLSRWWFVLVLAVARLLRMRIVWTAHNLLPHEPVFDDDGSARRALIERADLVIAHSRQTLDAIATTFSTPRKSAVIAHGPLAPATVTSLPGPKPTEPRRVLFIGRIATYKGVEDLVEAARDVDATALQVRIVGSCADPELAGRLRAAAVEAGAVTLELGYLPAERLASVLAWSDIVVYPFRTVTTSGSVTLASAAGRGMIIPDLPALADLPNGAVIRYAPTNDGLRNALMTVVGMPAEAVETMGRAARFEAATLSWQEIAEATAGEFRSLCGDAGSAS
jgi:glycosyltransferase involved in cell wall biosynthesis